MIEEKLDFINPLPNGAFIHIFIFIQKEVIAVASIYTNIRSCVSDGTDKCADNKGYILFGYGEVATCCNDMDLCNAACLLYANLSVLIICIILSLEKL